MTVLDASVLISYLGGDAHTQKATAILAEHLSGSCLHPVTLAEVLVGPAGRGAEVAVRDAIDDLGIEVAAADAGEPLLVARLRVSTGLRLPDCYPLATALGAETPLATFDTRLAAAARAMSLEVVGA